MTSWLIIAHKFPTKACSWCDGLVVNQQNVMLFQQLLEVECGLMHVCVHQAKQNHAAACADTAFVTGYVGTVGRNKRRRGGNICTLQERHLGISI